MDSKPITVEAILENPHAFGLPSFPEYCKMRQKLIITPADLFNSVDAGGSVLKVGNYVRKITYQFKKWHAVTLEKLESILTEEGIELGDLEIIPRVIPESSYKCSIVVEFMTKQDFERRRQIERTEAFNRQNPGL